MRALIEAAKAVLREALDAVDVHPCDVHDDAVRAKGLYGPMADLYAAASAPQPVDGSIGTEDFRHLIIAFDGDADDWATIGGHLDALAAQLVADALAGQQREHEVLLQTGKKWMERAEKAEAEREAKEKTYVAVVEPWHDRIILDGLYHSTDAIRAALAQVAGGQVPEPFILGNQYRTQGGRMVRFVKIHNEGKSYETMEDELGHNYYTSRDFGRGTGAAWDDDCVPPLYATPQPAPVAGPVDVLGYAIFRHGKQQAVEMSKFMAERWVDAQCIPLVAISTSKGAIPDDESGIAGRVEQLKAEIKNHLDEDSSDFKAE